MRTSTLLRWGGLAALLGGILKGLSEAGALLLIGNQADRTAALTAPWTALLALALAAAFLIMMGLVALYARQAQQSGSRGLIGFAFAALGTMLHSGHVWTGLFLIPALAVSVPEFLDTLPATLSTVTAGVLLSLVTFAFGWFLFGLASLRAKVVPRGPVVLVMVGAMLELVLGAFDLPLSALVFAAGIAWMGFWLWSERTTPAPVPTASHRPMSSPDVPSVASTGAGSSAADPTQGATPLEDL